MLPLCYYITKPALCKEFFEKSAKKGRPSAFADGRPVHYPVHYFAPVRLKTLTIVLKTILISSQTEQ